MQIKNSQSLSSSSGALGSSRRKRRLSKTASQTEPNSDEISAKKSGIIVTPDIATDGEEIVIEDDDKNDYDSSQDEVSFAGLDYSGNFENLAAAMAAQQAAAVAAYSGRAGDNAGIGDEDGAEGRNR